MLAKKSDLNINKLYNCVIENSSLEFQACGYQYVGNEARLIVSIYLDDKNMHLVSVHKNSNGNTEIVEDYFQIQSNDILVQRKIF